MAIQATSNLDIRLEEGAETVCLTIRSAEKLKGRVRLTADQVDSMIGTLATFRSQMEPAVPLQMPQDRPTHQTGGTAYHVGIEPFLDTAILSFRDPGLGWLSFQIDEEVLRRIVDQIAKAKARLSIPQNDTKQ